MNLWRETRDFFRKRTDQVIKRDVYLFDDKFLKSKEKTLLEYERVLERAGYILSLYSDEWYIKQIPPSLSLKQARAMWSKTKA